MNILFTGGGTTGHVTKNLIVMEALRERLPELKLHYAGLRDGKEAELVDRHLVRFHEIVSGKLRRYLAWETIPDAFRFVRGIWQSFWLVRKIKPRLVFSSGGYVAMPVAIGAWMNRVPVVTHETDSYPGLSNRIIARFAAKVCLGYGEAEPWFKAEKTVYTGNPVARSLFRGSREKGLEKLKFSKSTPLLMVMGGSQGAGQINDLVMEVIEKLVEDWQILHLTGAGKQTGFMHEQYREFEYVTDNYADFLMAADLVVTRGGGNSLAEVAALGKPAVVIPLPAPAAAGDHQRKNALEMQAVYPDWTILYGNELKGIELLEAVHQMKNVIKMSKNDKKQQDLNSEERILEVLMPFLR